MKPNNPFFISGYQSPAYFCDREQESKIMQDALYNGRNITLMAPRRMGKTGLVRHIFYQLRALEPDIITLYMDIYSTQNLGDFVRLFANTVLGQLDSAPQKALNRIAKFVKRCRPVVTFDELTGVPKVSVEIAPDDEVASLKEIFDYLKSADRRCYIAIDEFQQITAYPEKGVEALLRSYMQFVPNVNFIFSGSKQHVMQEMFLSAKKPFYQSTQMLTIGPIDREVYYQFAAGFFSERQLTLPRAVFEAMYERFGGHTWYMQNLLNRIYSYAMPVDETAVAHALDEIVAESTYAYEHLLNAYAPNIGRLLKAIALEGCVKEILSGKFIGKYHLKAASSVNVSLRKMLDNELVYKTPDGYIVYDRFMGEWLRRQGF